MKRKLSLLRGQRFVINLLFFGTVFTNAGFCGHATLKVTVRGIDQPSAEERLAIFAEAKTDEEAGGLIDRLLSQFKKPDLSGIAVTLKSDVPPMKITRLTDKKGEVLFENLPSVEDNELTAEREVLINGQTVKAKARTFTQSGTVFLQLHTDWVVLRGKVFDSDGKPLSGIHVKVVPMSYERPFSEFTIMHPPQTAVSDANGLYELPDVRPLDMKTTAYYLVNSNAAVRSTAYFEGHFYAGKTQMFSGENPFCFKLPLISENMLHRARRYITVFNKLGSGPTGKPLWTEKKGVYLPESKGDVIFLPDIIIDDDKSEVPPFAKDSKAKQ